MTKQRVFVTFLLVVIGGLSVGLYALYCRARASITAELEPVQKAAIDIRASLQVGVSYADYGHLLQHFSATIMIAEQKGVKPSALKPYRNALGTYEDAETLWSDKIDHPYCYEPSGQSDPTLDSLAEKYAVAGRSSLNGYENLRLYNTLIQQIWNRAGTQLEPHR